MEKPLTIAVKVEFVKNADTIKEALQLSEESWEKMNQERKDVLSQFKDDFIEGALSGAERPSFTKADVMEYLQDNASQELILLLAAESIGHTLQDILEKAQGMFNQDPMAMLLKALMGSKGGDDENTPQA